MPILDIQKRARELGRIRTGQVVPAGDGKTRPEKLDRFRLTSASKPLLEKVAELYGGQVAEWTPQGGGAQAWEVVTTSTRLPIMVPPQPITQWYEYWTAAGCQHRCDGRTNVLTDEICDPEDFKHTEALKKPTTRLNVVLRDVEGIGVWRLETHGWNAAVELPDAAEFLARAGGYVNGWVSLEPRSSKAEVPDRQNGGTKIVTRHFHVPIIEIDVTPAQLMAGEGRVATPSVEGPIERTAIEAPKADVPDYLAQAQDCSTVEAVQAIWWKAKNAGHMTDQLEAQLKVVGDALKAAGEAQAPQPDADGVVDAEIVPDGDEDAIWQQILNATGQQGMGLSETQEAYASFSGGVSAATATAAELQAFLTHLAGEQVSA
jgi:hypothetical protein